MLICQKMSIFRRLKVLKFTQMSIFSQLKEIKLVTAIKLLKALIRQRVSIFNRKTN